MQDSRTYVYIGGLANAEQRFEKAMAGVAGSEHEWSQKRWALMKQSRYARVLHD